MNDDHASQLLDRAARHIPVRAFPAADLRASCRAARRRRRLAATAGSALATLAIVATVVVLTGQLRPDTAPAPVAPTTRTTAALYFLTGSADQYRHIRPELHPVSGTGDPARDAVRALLRTQPRSQRLVNGYILPGLQEQPIRVLSVTQRANLITVDLSQDPFKEYQAIDCACPSGEILMQQLVWTTQTAIGSTAPVRLTVNGEPSATDPTDPSQRLGGRVDSKQTALANNTWPITADGRTYGTMPPAINQKRSTRAPSGWPDLVSAEGNDGVSGYVDSSLMNEPPASSPAEALRQQKNSRDRDVPVYGIDGTTIGTFTISGAANSTRGRDED